MESVPSICGFNKPKGTRLQAGIYQIMHDSTYWENPYEYWPERFLTQEGKFWPKQFFMAFRMLGES